VFIKLRTRRCKNKLLFLDEHLFFNITKNGIQKYNVLVKIMLWNIKQGDTELIEK
jgi:hypothetical protein